LFASEKASVSWVRQIADQEPDICVLPPSIQSSIGCKTLTLRIRQRTLQFVVNDSLQSVIDASQLKKILLSCHANHHVVVPLRMTLTRYHVYHTPEVRFNVVIETAPYVETKKQE